ncbi:hypothetical protein HK104_004403 [Borealophlyctis nickersoniae]|nr:hypothetical protein HK104_004403 [Borealophlyctis nickersoniae]
MTSPWPRGSTPPGAGCGAGLGCKGPCDSPRSRSLFSQQWVPKPQVVGRGSKIPIQWIRGNHPGGFVRLAVAPLSQSDSWTAFNTAAGSQYFCFERNCGPTNPNDMTFGKNNGPGAGTCSATFTVPDHLPDGDYTLQWIWFGGGVYLAQKDAGFGEFYTCTDIIVRGGAPKKTTKPGPKFVGGDYSNPNKGVCKYWSSNKTVRDAEAGCPQGG